MGDQSRSSTGSPRAASAPRDPAALKRRYLSAIDIFRDLSPQQLNDVHQIFRMTSVPKGRIVFQPDETGEGMFILKSGGVQVYRISPEGKRFVVSTVEPGAFFGEMAFLGQSMYGSFAETTEASVLCAMSRYDIEQLMQRYPTVAVRMMQALSQRLSETETQLEDLALKSLAARLATFILRHTGDDDRQMLGLTHNDLAERVGTSRETATQALNELKADGLIGIGRKRIEILDREGLEAIAESY
ncbi:MAG: Crp/Fnr family transcriptional regulator [Chloroflexi bacterium]|nr:Crp/Fnr family transcriptional regulator [Chloroflexota bacterium]